MNIIIYGLRGTGKTTLGKNLAKRLNKQFVDSDEIRLDKFKQTAEKVVKEGGWPLFRKQEKEATQEIAKNFDNAIIAVGGGTMMDPDNATALKRTGKTVLLIADINTMVERVYEDKNQQSNRPALTDDKTPKGEIEEVWRQRKDIYENLADLVVDTSNIEIEHAVAKIIDYFKLK